MSDVANGNGEVKTVLPSYGALCSITIGLRRVEKNSKLSPEELLNLVLWFTQILRAIWSFDLADTDLGGERKLSSEK